MAQYSSVPYVCVPKQCLCAHSQYFTLTHILYQHCVNCICMYFTAHNMLTLYLQMATATLVVYVIDCMHLYLLQVLLRLNVLPVLLCMTLGTPYAAYTLPVLLSLAFLFTVSFMASWPLMTPASLQGECGTICGVGCETMLCVAISDVKSPLL